ncbi:Clavaminate synthase-like protein [Aspergillus aculeatinus CBS 121060]|uniref:Clavaminate synthase-like protein n=1 Tax=Aspergillus aculeatinus CBS 121060 TaxID=1448322 RepID=A0ACD1GUP9_9EURO|nr:Clavaminate synthase-like protein [Aspergillus aculeatinus CBS 121060]RAH64996.1 Clavaminate synthase-like protein [Aspergillus aculeatinus CBS 121060]
MPLYAEQIAGLELREPDSDIASIPGAYSEPFEWPSEDELPGFRKTYIEYFAEALSLCRSLMRIFALALDLPEEFFDPMMEYPGATSRMLHYPSQSVDDTSKIGLGAHTDYECITILSQDEVPALQVRNSSEEWITVQPLPNTLVVNIADCLSMCSAQLSVRRQPGMSKAFQSGRVGAPSIDGLVCWIRPTAAG